MFINNTAFNQDISGWNTSNVANMFRMFVGSSSFNQDLSGWDVSGVTDMTDMFNGSGLSRENYDAALIGWAGQAVQNGVSLGATGIEYCNAGDQRQSLIDDDGWIITDDGLASSCPEFIVVIDSTLGADGTTANEVLIPTGTGAFNYNVSWTDAGGNTGSASGLTGDYTITAPTQGEVEVRISGQFPHFQSLFGVTHGVTDVRQWGNIQWGSMANMFNDESHVTGFTATDAPDLSAVTTMSRMFFAASSFNDDLSSWDVSNIESMDAMFWGASVFNGNIDNWNVSSVTNMGRMFRSAGAFSRDISGWNTSSLQFANELFRSAGSFNADLSSWDVSSVTNMHRMFWGNNFNQDISGWDVSSVQDMSLMFEFNDDFNQDISGWNVSSVNNMANMFNGASAFNQNLADWNVTSVTDMTTMFNGSGMSTVNYDATLIGWGNQAVQSGVTLDATATTYCNANPERQTLITTHSWTITDAGLDGGTGCPGTHITIDSTLGTDGTTNNQVGVYIGGAPHNYNLVWVDSGGEVGTAENVTTDYIIDVANQGAVDVRISGTFFHFNSSTNTVGITDVSQWGQTGWSSMVNMFNAETGLTGFSASDAPDLSGVTRMSNMFRDASNFNSPINNWDVSNIERMDFMFFGASSFNQDLDLWDVSSVTNMNSMLRGASAFNGNVSTWDVRNAVVIQALFRGTAFNGDVSGWEFNSTTSLNRLFAGATNFNQDISMWDVSGIEDIGGMFQGASSFDQDISGWDVSNVVTLQNTFNGAGAFNQDISGWDTSNVDSMINAFLGASSFNQNLGGWDLSNITDMTNMLNGAGLSEPNYSQTLIGWGNFVSNNAGAPSGITLGASGQTYSATVYGGAPYSDAVSARGYLTGTAGWTISGDSL